MIQMYNAGKPFFWEDGWYPIKDRLIEGGLRLDEDLLIIDISRRYWRSGRFVQGAWA
jgi:hypothetical protein